MPVRGWVMISNRRKVLGIERPIQAVVVGGAGGVALA